jgi:hypothetical protein
MIFGDVATICPLPGGEADGLAEVPIVNSVFD